MAEFEREAMVAHLIFHSESGSSVRTRGGNSSYILPFEMALRIHSSVAILLKALLTGGKMVSWPAHPVCGVSAVCDSCSRRQPGRQALANELNIL